MNKVGAGVLALHINYHIKLNVIRFSEGYVIFTPVGRLNSHFLLQE